MLQGSIRSFTATVALFAACSAPHTETPTPDVAPDAHVIGDTYANPRALVDTEWVLAHLDDPAVHFIDVSPRRDSYDAGHLPGAQFVQWDTDLTDPDAAVEGMILTRDSVAALMSRLGVGNGHTVVFYDNARNLFAARGYWVMKYHGHDDVRVYDGGSRKWVADGQQLTNVVAEPAPARYVAGEPDPTIVTDWQYVVASIGETGPLLCDTRSADEHAGIDVRAESGGHIPGAVNIEWTRNVRDDGTFLDARSLADLYRAAGFTPDREIITYCQAGVRGAHTWFVLTELLGYPRVRNYDGSWAEYGNRHDSPIG